MSTEESPYPILAPSEAFYNSVDARQISSCELCGNSHLSPALNLGSHPLCDDLIPLDERRECRSYPIEILYCDVCRTAHQKYQVPKNALFPMSYHYRSRFTRDVLSGMGDLVTQCEQRYGCLAGKKVLDVGCNDGSLMDLFAKRGAVCWGIEPTGAAVDARTKGHVVYNDFFTPVLAEMIVERQGQPDFVVFTNVFAHIENMSSLLASVEALLAPATVLVVENHYLGSIITTGQFDTFYHEHPRTYSATSFQYVARALERKVEHIEFPNRYGGNIRVFIGNSGKTTSRTSDSTSVCDIEEAGFCDGLRELTVRMESWREYKSAEFDALVDAHGPLKAKAFPGRAAILLRLLGVDRETITSVYEKPGSMKVGYYAPGTRIPIKSDDELFAADDLTQPIVNLAWHISSEIKEYLTENGYRGNVVDILDLSSCDSSVLSSSLDHTLLTKHVNTYGK